MNAQKQASKNAAITAIKLLWLYGFRYLTQVVLMPLTIAIKLKVKINAK
jgi:hypothetical protein